MLPGVSKHPASVGVARVSHPAVQSPSATAEAPPAPRLPTSCLVAPPGSSKRWGAVRSKGADFGGKRMKFQSLVRAREVPPLSRARARASVWNVLTPERRAGLPCEGRINRQPPGAGGGNRAACKCVDSSLVQAGRGRGQDGHLHTVVCSAARPRGPAAQPRDLQPRFGDDPCGQRIERERMCVHGSLIRLVVPQT